MVMQVQMGNTVAKGQCKCKMGNAPHTLPTHYEIDGIDVPIYMYAKQKHLGCKKGEANQKQQLSDYKSIHSYTCD